MNFMRPVWAEINLANIVHNFREVRGLVGDKTKIMSVVKANAYGHGAIPVSRALDAAGSNYFGVAIMNEAVELRQAGLKKPLLILGWTPPEDYQRALAEDITLTIYSLEEARELSRISFSRGNRVKVHLKIDTGMGRIGFQDNGQAMEEIKEILPLPGLDVEGIFTHLARADEKDKEYTLHQLERFKGFVSRLESSADYKFRIKHAANSAAVIDHPEVYFDMVRPGIMLYGLEPSTEVNLGRVSLRQAFSLRAKVSHVKDVPAGFPVSYGGIYVTSGKTRIATIPLGYADGYTRLLTGKGQILFRGQRAPIVGRICMDQLMFDVTELIPEVSKGDMVTLIGKDGNNFISVDEIAGLLGTINYEVTCMISQRVPRVYQGFC